MKEKEFKYDYLANNNSKFISEIADLKYNQWKESSPETTFLDRKQETIDSCNLDSFPITFIGLLDNKLVGFVTIIKCDNKFDYINKHWLVALYIKEDYRRKGIATNLLSFTENQLKSLGIPKVYLWTESKDLDKFYKNRNWKLENIVQYKDENTSIFSKLIMGVSE